MAEEAGVLVPGWLFEEFGAGAAGIVVLELVFLSRLWIRSRRRESESDLVADAVRLGLQQRRKRVIRHRRK